MIHDSCVCEACVERAMSGRATLSEDMAAVTAARARHTTAVTAPWRTVGDPVTGAEGDFRADVIGFLGARWVTGARIVAPGAPSPLQEPDGAAHQRRARTQLSHGR